MKQLYKTYGESTQIFQELQEKYPQNFRLESIGQTWEKRDINLITISADIEKADEKPALFYTGTIHAREWVGHELAVEFAQHILNNMDIDPSIQECFSKATIYMVPCVNPDGFEYSQKHFSFWRKNRRLNADGSYGVDLNRNFPVGFNKSSMTSSNVYGGPEPFSEPETSALRDFVENHQNIKIALDYHSQGNVFFPAHDFRHEDMIDTTDLNILCANMAEEIRRISGREYGIHQGKPPAKLIGGSGREYYYSRGILSTVVEVGTRNISDYLDDMNEHLREHIPALLTVIEEVPNYCKQNPAKRVESFEVTSVGSNHIRLQWEGKTSKQTYYEIYRSTRDKKYCKQANLIAKTQALEFTDINLTPNRDYYYNIRAVNKTKKLKSPFFPQIKARTKLEYDEYSRTYFASAKKTGYLAENINNNAKHFGINSLFVGVDDNKGISYSVITVDLKTIPKDAIIKYASLHLYPINRVSTTIEKYGEWNIGIIDQTSVDDITDFDQVHNAKIISYIGRPTRSDQLTQGIWRKWEFSGIEASFLTNEIQNDQVIFRIEGPKELRVGRKSQMMQWDIGYGKFGFGLPYRPRLEITYTVKPTSTTLYPKAIHTISKKESKNGEVSAGFDKEGNKVYSIFEFNLASLPAYDYTMITKAYVELNSTTNYIKEDIRFHLEFVEEDIERSYKGLDSREVIQNIGYDVSANDLKNNQTQYFVFDSYSEIEINKKLKDRADITFVLTPTSSKKITKNKMISWEVRGDSLAPKLIIEHIPKRRFPVEQVRNAKVELENGKIKLTWDNPNDEDFKGVKVIKNAYRKPFNHQDGQKLYAGKDSYTFDDFGAKDKDKYFAIFTFDDIPNYSDPIVLEYEAK